MAKHYNDRDPYSFERAQGSLREAHELCIVARSFDPPKLSDAPARADLIKLARRG